MTKITKMFLSLFCVSMLTILATNSFAGDQVVGEVGVNTGERWAEGALGAAHNSVDKVQKIGCMITATATSLTINCGAVTKTNFQGQCKQVLTGSAASSNMLTALQSMNGDSFLRFTWDADGNCTSIVINNNSKYWIKS